MALLEDVNIGVTDFEKAVPFHFVRPGHSAPDTKGLVTNVHSSARITGPNHTRRDRAAGIYVECSFGFQTAVESQVVFSFAGVHCRSNALASTDTH